MSKKTYFQYQKELNLPIYLSADLSAFDPSFGEFLAKIKFVKLSDKEESEALGQLRKNNRARILHISEATPVVAKQIQSTMESDHYGAESIIPKDGYRVYRYKDVGLMVYSFGAKEWQLGCYRDFGSSQVVLASRMIMNRFLSWALVPHGIVGLWGVTVDDGMVAQRPLDSKGEAVFIDIVGLRMISFDGIKKLRPHFKILRLDPTLKGRNIKMSNEELLSFLSAHCSYLDTAGLSVPVRQMVQALSKMTEGLLHPQESFRPRTDLSL
ncbi:MAG: hypothetical protein ACXVLQ_03975 [Bacteriovorax sp.]